MRTGNFSSSEIYKLMANDKSGGLGKPALTYIQEKNFERKLGRSLSSESFSYPTSWGNCIEGYVHEQLGFEYKLASKERLTNPNIPYHTGAPDLITTDFVSDIKCPFTMKSFCELSESIAINELENDYPEYFWQLCSNAILTDKNFAELIVFCPMFSEFEAIAEYIDSMDAKEKIEYEWLYNNIVFDRKNKLPYLTETSTYNRFAKLRFEVTAEMKQNLTDRILLAGKLLINI